MYCRTLVSEAKKQGKVCNKLLEPQNTNDQVGECSEYTVPTKHEPASKKQRKQHHTDSVQPTMKGAPKTTARKKVLFRHVKLEEPVSANTDLSVVTTRSWTGLLRHRMAPECNSEEERLKVSFSVVINWDTEKVRNRDKDEQLLGEYGKCRTIERIDYQNITRLAEADLEMYVQELQGGQPQQGGTGEMSRETTTKEQ
ncbi:hypothetical protein Cgig2_010100 [Carnegiea gigantea]|uniref:Uncharacterized protein n=1 Tax=Carnegiea gigantea TaxID=171969 RepID=A0A9Q1K6F0_9CARY|nr:hypothetical protein Cgig2_010100 [Carnegiea gigantea]